MIIDKKPLARRRGISGIIAAVMLFAMLFSVGTSYFLFVNNNNLLYSQAASARNSATQNALAESALVSASAAGGTSVITFTVDNTGGVALNITSFFLTSSSNSLEFCQHGSSSPCPTLPVVVSVGATSNAISTGTTYASPTTYTLRVVTQRGNVFTTTYPPTATSLAAQALSSGAIGDLYMKLGTFTWYTVSSCGSGNYCLNNQGLGFSMPTSESACNTCYTAFSVSITDLNPAQYNITLDEYSQLLLFWGHGSSFRNQPWYIISNSSNTISSTYSPVTLFYNQPVTLLFGSSTPGSFSLQSLSGSNAPTAGSVASVFIVSHGWKNIQFSKQAISNSNYGQNSPYVSILFY
ncbi:MAG: hypothetical protein JRN13_07120 [Nitrososphaerota archaeon]|jgi:flagellin-like protein|nr:hypothetical protein [Nitrososphaerota archaeon]MDG6900204.1 hypothetical protein [Nitrososphaerota archaeon]MDG6921222.1 hypothetical protein [Nitrososphaerota archaeon]MDG6954889.1 hypothetical protein [Nitrososphaerota archaeon]MDG6969466.1 hypothetical protein [Nitrososphaerota archaeon]